jgi:hypothetical protein
MSQFENILWGAALIIAAIIVIPIIIELLPSRKMQKDGKSGKYGIVNHVGMDVSGPYVSYEFAHKEYLRLKQYNNVALVRWIKEGQYEVIEQ